MSLPEQIFFAVTLLFIGSCVGSFLNVVIYRLPAGLSLSRPPSHCPRCRQSIRARDNVPILGWWSLGGRCRDCGLPISARYPLIEAMTGALFLLVGAARFIAFSPDGSPERIIDWLMATGLDLFPLCSLLCAAMIQIDGQRPSLKLFVPALGAGLAACLALPGLLAQLLSPFAAASSTSALADSRLPQLAASGLGVVAGLLGDWLVRGRKRSRRSLVTDPLAVELAMIGLFWGWAIVALAIVSLLIAALPLVKRRRVPEEGYLLAAAIVGVIAGAIFVPAP